MKYKPVICSLLLACLSGSLGYSAEESTQGNVMTSNEITKLPSGLGYQVLKAAPADAKSPKKGDTVVVNYTGWLDDQGKEGKKFDSSLDRKTPFSFKIGIGQVISGWDTGVMLMKVGEKCRLYIPADLGYGARGAGGAIPPNAALIFDVELLEVKP
jgi:peptidylprolyl isomerase